MSRYLLLLTNVMFSVLIIFSCSPYVVNPSGYYIPTDSIDNAFCKITQSLIDNEKVCLYATRFGARLEISNYFKGYSVITSDTLRVVQVESLKHYGSNSSSAWISGEKAIVQHFSGNEVWVIELPKCIENENDLSKCKPLLGFNNAYLRYGNFKPVKNDTILGLEPIKTIDSCNRIKALRFQLKYHDYGTTDIRHENRANSIYYDCL